MFDLIEEAEREHRIYCKFVAIPNLLDMIIYSPLKKHFGKRKNNKLKLKKIK